jgi:hypothetical protein
MSQLEAAWEAVQRSPDDEQALSVLADVLLESGELLGEVIRLQLDGRNDEAFQVIGAHAARWLGDEARLLRLQPVWRRGFVDTATGVTLEDLDALFGSPAGRLLRVLTVDHQFADRLPPAFLAICERAPSSLRRVTFGTERHVHFTEATVEVAELLQALALEALDVRSWRADLSGAASRSLTHLALTLEIAGQSVARSLATAHFPQLVSTELTLPFERLDLPISLLNGEVAPRVRSLIIRGVLWPEQVHELSLSPLLKGLGHLKLQVASETAWHEALVEAAERFSHLRTLEIRGPRTSEDWETQVKDALPRATIQR